MCRLLLFIFSSVHPCAVVREIPGRRLDASFDVLQPKLLRGFQLDTKYFLLQQKGDRLLKQRQNEAKVK